MSEYTSNRQRQLKIGISSYTENQLVLDVIGNTNILGIANLGNVQVSSGVITAISGIITYYGDGSKLVNIVAATANYANLAGVATYASNAGVATYSDFSGIANYSNFSGIATYASSAGIATYAGIAGIATYTPNAGVATALQYSRTFQITGDVVSSIVSFDGTQNVSLASTIQPNSVELGTDTYGDYVQSISGTANQIDVIGGTGESSTPTVSIALNPLLPGNVTIQNDLQINNNLNVTGNITIGGTSAYIIVNDFRVKDKDIVLGFTTDSYGNDVSNDTTANHGGISVASTEGNPLVELYNVGAGETSPITYKKIMWFKAGSFAGQNQDAWLFNYAVGIGSTQFPAGTILAAGAVQFTENDLKVIRNIDASGIITATNFVGNLTGVANTATNLADAANITTGTINSARLSGLYNINVPYSNISGIATNVIGGIGSITNLTVSGVSTLGNVQISSGVVTASTGIVTYYGDGSGLINIQAQSIVGIITYAANAGLSTSAQGLTGTPNITITNLNASGISTLNSVQISSGIVTATSGIVTYYGDGSKLTGIISGIGIATSGTIVGTGVTLINLTGPGVSTVTVSSGIATINITGSDISPVMMGMIF